MTALSNLASKIRSKNAGPFWVTVDLFFDDPQNYSRVCKGLTTSDIATLFHADTQLIKRFEIDDLMVLKFSLPRPNIQGTPADSDMHGAALGALLKGYDLVHDA